MPRFSVMHVVYAATHTVVEAETLEDAIELAGLNAHYSVCHQCSDHLEVSDLGEAIQAINLDTNECHDLTEAQPHE